MGVESSVKYMYCFAHHDRKSCLAPYAAIKMQPKAISLCYVGRAPDLGFGGNHGVSGDMGFESSKAEKKAFPEEEKKYVNRKRIMSGKKSLNISNFIP